MRDIQKYTSDYDCMDDPANRFETEYQVVYRRKKVLEELKRYQHDTILEVGCGLDSYVNYITEFKKAVVVEPSPKFAEKAKNDLDKNERVTVICSTLEKAVKMLEHQTFDFIIVSGLLNEIEEPVDFLKSIKRLCKNGHTVIHVNVANADSVHRLWAVEMGLIKNPCEASECNKKFQQTTVFQMESLKQTILESAEEGAIEILDMGSYFLKPFSHKQMMQCIEQGILTETLIDGLDKMVKYFPEYGSEIYINYRIR